MLQRKAKGEEGDGVAANFFLMEKASQPQHVERRSDGEVEAQTYEAMIGVEAARLKQRARRTSSMSLATWFATQGLGDVGKKLEEHGYTRMEDVKELRREDLVDTLEIDEADADKLLGLLSQEQ